MKYSTGKMVIDFNEKWVRTKTLSQFQKHEAHTGLTKEQLEEVYRTIKDSSFSEGEDIS